MVTSPDVGIDNSLICLVHPQLSQISILNGRSRAIVSLLCIYLIDRMSPGLLNFCNKDAIVHRKFKYQRKCIITLNLRQL